MFRLINRLIKPATKQKYGRQPKTELASILKGVMLDFYNGF